MIMITNRIDPDPSNMSNPRNIGELIEVLEKLDRNIPIKLLADHSISSCTIKGEERYLHSLHLDIVFDYVG